MSSILYLARLVLELARLESNPGPYGRFWRNCRRERHKVNSDQQSIRASKGREISHFMIGLFILLIINLPPSLAVGKVMHFTDSRGVLHITSSGQEPQGKSKESVGNRGAPDGETLPPGTGPEPDAAKGSAPAAGPPSKPKPGTEKIGPSQELGALEQPGAPHPVIRIHSGGGGKIELSKASLPAPVSALPGAPPVRPVAAVSPISPAQVGGILSFKDHQGVMHITNLSATPELGGRRYAARESLQSSSPIAGQPQVIQPVSWQPAGTSGPAASDTANEVGLIAAREPVIHRFRDRRGVWHITNLGPSGRAIPAAYLAKAPAPATVLDGPIQVPPAYALLRTAGISGTRPASGQLSVRSRLDRHGILHISNASAQNFSPTFGAVASLANLKEYLGPIITEATQIYGLPSALVMAVIKMESNCVPWAVSPKGAMGLMQLMPGTATDLGVRDPFNPRENILAGCRYLRTLVDQFQGSLPLAVAAYNAGNRRVIAAGYTIPPIKETQEFVSGVMGLYYLMEKMEKTGQRL